MWTSYFSQINEEENVREKKKREKKKKKKKKKKKRERERERDKTKRELLSNSFEERERENLFLNTSVVHHIDSSFVKASCSKRLRAAREGPSLSSFS